MKKFILAVFKISFWEILVVLVLGALKYAFVAYELDDKITRPFVWICLCAGLLFIISLGITGAIENKYGSFEKWETEARSSKTGRFLLTFTTWSRLIPTILGCLIFIYFVAPTTISVFVAFAVIIFLRNSIRFIQQ